MNNTPMKATEKRHPDTMNLDNMSTYDVLQVMNQADKTVPEAVNNELEQIEKASSAVIASFQRGGRLIYIGAGTSGRLGLLDAVECPPTFGTDPGDVQALIAGGGDAIMKAVEGAEDDPALAESDLGHLGISDKDTVVGIAASGRTPYVISGLQYASRAGAHTVSISCNKHATMSQHATTPIEVEVGPEILTGSTRLKAGTAQKLVLNMITTSAMVGIGKAYKNLMVDVQPTNQKLVERAKHMIATATAVDGDTAAVYFEKADRNPKMAIVMLKQGCNATDARKYLDQANGFVRTAIKLANEERER